MNDSTNTFLVLFCNVFDQNILTLLYSEFKNTEMCKHPLCKHFLQVFQTENNCVLP